MSPPSLLAAKPPQRHVCVHVSGHRGRGLPSCLLECTRRDGRACVPDAASRHQPSCPCLHLATGRSCKRPGGPTSRPPPRTVSSSSVCAKITGLPTAVSQGRCARNVNFKNSAVRLFWLNTEGKKHLPLPGVVLAESVVLPGLWLLGHEGRVACGQSRRVWKGLPASRVGSDWTPDVSRRFRVCSLKGALGTSLDWIFISQICCSLRFILFLPNSPPSSALLSLCLVVCEGRRFLNEGETSTQAFRGCCPAVLTIFRAHESMVRT